MIRFWVIVVFVFSLSCGVKGQRVLRNTSILNYQRGDRTFVHFGFTLGVNYMDYRMVFSGKNSLRGETGKLDVGFLVGIVSELRVTDDLGLRFLPGLEFATRRTVFTHVPDVEDNKTENYNESVYITLPLMMARRDSPTERTPAASQCQIPGTIRTGWSGPLFSPLTAGIAL